MFLSAIVLLPASCLTSLLSSFVSVCSPWLSLTLIEDHIQFSIKERVPLETVDIKFGLIKKIPLLYKQSRLQRAFEKTILKAQEIVSIM